MKTKMQQLKVELKDAGASNAELKTLIPLAEKLQLLSAADLGKTQSLKEQRRWKSILKPLTLILSGAAVGVLVVMISLSVLPNSLLYPVQKISDNVAIAVHPEYRAQVMMERAQQVNQLVASHADPHLILATLATYNSEAAVYKSMAQAHYAALEYCRTSLQQAATAAPTSVQKAIAVSLNSLENV